MAQGKGWGTSSVKKEIELCSRFVPKRPGLVIDVGGNIGDWSEALLSALTPDRLLIVEPDAGNANRLRSRFAGRAEIIEAALSDQPGEAMLYTDRPGSGLASLHHRDLRHVGRSLDQTAIVQKTTLQALLGERGLSTIDLLKLDIEGHEFAVLAAADLSRINCIQFEFGGSNIDSRTYLRDFWYLLQPTHDLFRITPFGAAAMRRYAERDEVFITTNFIAVRR